MSTADGPQPGCVPPDPVPSSSPPPSASSPSSSSSSTAATATSKFRKPPLMPSQSAQATQQAANFTPLDMHVHDYSKPEALRHARQMRESIEQALIRKDQAAQILVVSATTAGPNRDKLYGNFHTLFDPSSTFYANTDLRGLVHRFQRSSNTPQAVHLSYADTCAQLQLLGKEGFCALVTRQGAYSDSEASRNRPNPYDVIAVLFPTSTYAGNGIFKNGLQVPAHVMEMRGWASTLEARMVSVVVNDSGASSDLLNEFAGFVASFSAQEVLCVSFEQPTPATECMVDTVRVHLLERALERVERAEAREDVTVAPEIQLRRVFATQHILQRAGLDTSVALQLLGESRFQESVDCQRLLEQIASQPGANGDALNAVRLELAECEQILRELQIN